MKWKKESRSICPEVFLKKEVLKNFAKSTGKHLYWCLFLIELETPEQVLSFEFCGIFKRNYFVKLLWRAAFEKNVYLDSIEHNLLEQFPQTRLILLYYFHQKILIQENMAIFKKCNPSLFFYLGNQIFAYHAHIFSSLNITNYLYIKEAC